MARLSKAELFTRFENAIRQGGWTWQMDQGGANPTTYKLYRGTDQDRLKVYIWNITPGGNTRPQDEYRIQPTGIKKFEIEPDVKCMVLGLRDDIGIFGAWDVRKHLQHLGKSSSMQISEGSLFQAVVSGFAPYFNSRKETAIAFRPDFMSTYIECFHNIHDFGSVPAESEILIRIGDDPYKVGDSDIIENVAEPRRTVLYSTTRALSAIDFSNRVLGAYGHRCAICCVQLRLIEGAHILPVSHPDSTDATSNGVALCALHHRSYDRGLVTFDKEYKIKLNGNMVRSLIDEDKAAGLQNFREMLRPIIHLPPDRRDVPDRVMIEKANHLRGWQF